MATRTLITTTKQDAAIAWRAAQLRMTEDQLIATFSSVALEDLVRAYEQAEAARVFEAYKLATTSAQAAAKTALGLS